VSRENFAEPFLSFLALRLHGFINTRKNFDTDSNHNNIPSVVTKWFVPEVLEVFQGITLPSVCPD